MNYFPDNDRAQPKHIENNYFHVDNLHQYERKQHKQWFDEEYSKYVDKGSWLNCNAYKIQSKVT
jgi:hypothetical protein